MKNPSPATIYSSCFIALIVVFCAVACKKKSDPEPIPVKPTEVFKIEDILKGSDLHLKELVNKVRGSVGTRGPGSKTIWSRKNDYQLGLYISANHVYNLSGWNSRQAQFFDPNTTNIGIFETSQIPSSNGNVTLGGLLTADFPLLHFGISPTATNTTILPAEDFYMGLLDNQRTTQGPFPKYPAMVQISTPLEMYDPTGRTLTNKTWTPPQPGASVIAVGYPQDKANYPSGAVSTGKVLSNTEAARVLQELKINQDSEGDIPYNQTAEFLVQGQAIAGMSGGGVFNDEGQLLGIMVRASESLTVPYIIRVVRIDYIRNKMINLFNEMPLETQQKLLPFVRGEL